MEKWRSCANVTFHVDQDEMVAIIGPNGAGKSTLLKTISGLVRAQSGEVQFENDNITGMSPDQVVRRGLAYVPEGGRVFPNMTVLDNLMMGAYSNPAILKTGILDEIYKLFPILKKRSNAICAHPERRRAPDAGDWARAGLAPEADHAGRAFPGGRPQAGR